MRIKKDTILKVNTLAATQHLTNEEYGALIRYIQIQDDRDGYRYEDLRGIFLTAFQKWEKEASEEFEKMVLINPSILSAYNNIFKQVSHSRRKFEEMQDKYDEKDGKKDKEKTKAKGKKETGYTIEDLYFCHDGSKEYMLTKEQMQDEYEELKKVYGKDNALMILSEADRKAILDNYTEDFGYYIHQAEQEHLESEEQ